MIIYSLFSFIILKIKIYKHHVLSVSIFLFLSILYEEKFRKGHIINNLLNYLIISFQSLYYILIKFVILKNVSNLIKSYLFKD